MKCTQSKTERIATILAAFLIVPNNLKQSEVGGVYESAQAAITKFHRLDGLNNRDVFSHSSGD